MKWDAAFDHLSIGKPYTLILVKNERSIWLRSRKYTVNVDAHLCVILCSARPGARPGRRRRRCRSAGAARAQAARRGAAPYSATTPARARARPANGTGTTGYNTVELTALEEYWSTTFYAHTDFKGCTYGIMKLTALEIGKVNVLIAFNFINCWNLSLPSFLAAYISQRNKLEGIFKFVADVMVKCLLLHQWSLNHQGRYVRIYIIFSC